MRKDIQRGYAGRLLLVAVTLLPAILWGAVSVYQRSDNGIHQWLPRDYEATNDYYRFRDLFGSDEALLVTWVGCTLGDDRLEEFASFWKTAGDDNELSHVARHVEHVTTGTRVYRQLIDPPIDVRPSLAAKRLRGVLIGPDEESTCAVLTVNAQTAEERRAVVDAVRHIAIDRCGVPESDLRLSGDTAVSVAIDTESEAAIGSLVWISAALALIIAWLSLRSLTLAIIVFALAQYCQAVSEAVIFFSGGSMNLLVIMVPVLVYVLSISTAVHLVNYYRESTLEFGPAAAPAASVRAGWQPCTVAAVTTAVGLGSLCVSHVAPISAFGFYGAIGVLLSVAVLLLLLPATVWLATQRLRGLIPTHRPSDRSSWIDSPLHAALVAPVLIVVGFAILFLCAGWGLTRTKPTVQPVRFLPAESRWLKDIYWYRDHIGPLSNVEVVLAFRSDDRLTFADRMRLVRDVQLNLGRMKHVQGTISCATFAPQLGRMQTGQTSMGAFIGRVVTDRLLAERRGEYLQERYLAEDDSKEYWRISARVLNLADKDQDKFLRELEERSLEVLAAARVGPERAEMTITGAVPMVIAAQRELLESLVISFGTALLLIAVVMALLLRSSAAGLLAMIPNVFPALITFGVMGWIGSLVDVGTMMTASVGLGIAVDDTLHFLTWYRRSLAAGHDKDQAIRVAYHRCAPAMLQTTLIAGLALAVFFFSSFQPVSQFGLIIFVLLATALVGDLLLLPALLATRLGRCFHP